jgi:hypothetical protein
MENLTRPIVCDILSDVQSLDVYERKEIINAVEKASTSAPVPARVSPFVAELDQLLLQSGQYPISRTRKFAHSQLQLSEC